MSTILYTIERDDDEFDIEVEYTVSRFDPGRTYGLPEDCYPPEGGEIEDFHATQDGKPIELTAAEIGKIEQRIYETHDYESDQYVD